MRLDSELPRHCALPPVRRTDRTLALRTVLGQLIYRLVNRPSIYLGGLGGIEKETGLPVIGDVEQIIRRNSGLSAPQHKEAWAGQFPAYFVEPSPQYESNVGNDSRKSGMSSDGDGMNEKQLQRAAWNRRRFVKSVGGAAVARRFSAASCWLR